MRDSMNRGTRLAASRAFPASLVRWMNDRNYSDIVARSAQARRSAARRAAALLAPEGVRKTSAIVRAFASEVEANAGNRRPRRMRSLALQVFGLTRGFDSVRIGSGSRRAAFAQFAGCVRPRALNAFLKI
jgi:hypothetical protein